MSENNNCMYCHNELNLGKLCADCANICFAKIDTIESNDICTQSAHVKDLSVENEIANKICVSDTLQASQLWSDKSYSNNLCVVNATINNACISNLNVPNFVPCIKYRATVNYNANTTYTLGTFLNFDNIVDDPNGNISLSPTTYTAPVSGYYLFTYKVNIVNVVSTSGPVLGIPVANPEIYVNGVLVRETFSPFLSFFSTQKVIVDSLITLQAGDKVTMKYNILADNGVSLAGTVDIVGAGIEDGNSLFKIIFISGLCQEKPSCSTCPIVSIPCGSVTTPCNPLTICDRPKQEEPCESCQ